MSKYARRYVPTQSGFLYVACNPVSDMISLELPPVRDGKLWLSPYEAMQLRNTLNEKLRGLDND